jgi:hypothetical protein
MEWSMWTAPIQGMLDQFLLFAPKIASALVFLVGGLFISWIVQLFSVMIFRLIKLDSKLSDLWLFRLWSKSLHGQKPSKTISHFFYYITLFVFILIVIKILGGDVSEKILGSLLGLIPRVFSFMLILFLGFMLAMFLSVIAQVVLVSANIQYPNFWGKVIAWGTFGVAVLFSLEQLGIAGKFVTVIFLVVLGTIGLASSIALGLGCKDLAREFIIELLKKNKGNGS